MKFAETILSELYTHADGGSGPEKAKPRDDA